jgi:hypothetical protein
LRNISYLIEESGWKEYQTKKKISRKYLTSIYEKVADETGEIEKITKKGKPLRIAKWSKNGENWKKSSKIVRNKNEKRRKKGQIIKNWLKKSGELGLVWSKV